ncbi:MAG: hypothetical protein V4662_24320 [Verrucomicrobiota bacterium]
MSHSDWEYLQDEAQCAMIEEGIATRQRDQIAGVLGTYGDAVQERIDECLNDAKQHQSSSQYKAAVVSSVTVIELILRHLIIRPVVEGAFLSEEWADMLVSKILARRSGTDRELLPSVLRVWSIDLPGLQLKDGRALWKTFTSEIVPKRNRIVHNGEPAVEADAETAIACAEAFLADVVSPLSDKFGFSWSVSRQWNPTTQGIGGATSSSYFTPHSPFET